MKPAKLMMINSEQLSERDMARDTLALELQDPMYEAYASGKGALTLDQLDENDVVDMDMLERVVELHGWPTKEDNDFCQVHDLSRDTLLERLFNNEPHIGMTNLRAMLAMKPLMSFDDWNMSDGLSAVKGANPPFLRAHAIAPQLMYAIKGALEPFDDDPSKNLQAYLNQSEGESIPKPDSMTQLKNHLSQPENAVTLEAIHLAYRMMGRLATVREAGPHDTTAHDTLTH